MTESFASCNKRLIESNKHKLDLSDFKESGYENSQNENV